MPQDPIIISQYDDVRITHYRNLRDKVLRKDGNRFIIEGLRLLERAATADIERESVLIESRQLPAVLPHVGPNTAVYIADRDVMTRIAGLTIHTGVLSIGLRPAELTLDELMQRCGERAVVLIAPHIKETANFGAMVRVATAFGVDGMIIGPECCDPFYRRSVRVSMGSVFTLPFVRSENLMTDLSILRQQFGFTLLATVLDEDAIALNKAARPHRVGLILGHEVDGLDEQLVAACDGKVTIPMQMQTDSLNVSISAAVFLYHFTQVADVRSK